MNAVNPATYPDTDGTQPSRGGWHRYAVYPALMIGCGVICAVALDAGLVLETVIVPIFVGLIVLLMLLERLMPFRRDWHTTGPEAARDGVYLTQGIFAGGLAQIISATAAVALAVGDNGMPLWLSAPLAVMLADLFYYGFHRYLHRDGFWWRAHGIHHVTTKVNALNTNTVHFLDILVGNVVIYTPLLLLGFGPEAIFIVTVARAMQTYGIHANIDVRLGWLGYFIMGPEHHRLHHSTDPTEAGNYATVLTLWDWVFGTLVYTPGRTIAQAGVAEPHALPEPRRYFTSAMFPFRPPQ